MVVLLGKTFTHSSQLVNLCRKVSQFQVKTMCQAKIVYVQCPCYVMFILYQCQKWTPLPWRREDESAVQLAESPETKCDTLFSMLEFAQQKCDNLNVICIRRVESGTLNTVTVTCPVQRRAYVSFEFVSFDTHKYDKLDNGHW